MIPRGRDGNCGFEVEGRSGQTRRKVRFPNLQGSLARESSWLAGTPHLYTEPLRGDGWGLSGNLKQGGLMAKKRVSG